MRKWPRLHLQTKMTYPSPNASMYPAHSPKAQDTCRAAFPVKQLNPVKSRFITSELSVHEFHTSMEYCIELASSFESQFRALITWYSRDLLPVFPCLQNRLIKMRWVGKIFKRQVEARLEGGRMSSFTLTLSRTKKWTLQVLSTSALNYVHTISW